MAESHIGRFLEADLTGTYMTTPHASWRMVDYGPAGIMSEDPLSGPQMFGSDSRLNGIVNQLIRTPGFDRSFDLGQLSRLQGEGAITNITAFSTAGGNVCQIPFIKFVGEQLHADEQSVLGWIIAQAITDVSHGPLRHGTDMEAEGLGGKQVFHEQRKLETYELGGMLDVFNEHGIQLNSDGFMDGINIPHAVESSTPHVNADNFQYVTAEMYEWFAGYADHPNPEVAKMCDQVVERLKRISRIENYAQTFEIDADGEIIFRHVEVALFFQKCQMLASTEDWKDPISRVLMHLYVQDLKYHKLARRLPHMSELDNGTTMHPQSYMYYVDSNIVEAQACSDTTDDEYLYVSRNLKKHISQEERDRFVRHKLRRYAEFLCDDSAVVYPNETINGHAVQYGLPSSRVEILSNKIVEGHGNPLSSAGAVLAGPELQSEEGVTYVLDPLKNRVVRPYVRNAQGERVFIDEHTDRLGMHTRYALASRQLYKQHQSLQWQQLTVRLVASRGYASKLKDTFRLIETGYNDLLSRPKMSPDQQRRQIGRAALDARAFALRAGLLKVAA